MRANPNRLLRVASAAALATVPGTAHASFLAGETLDKAADVLAWIVLIVAPIVGIAVFWLVHILPEKIAEKKKHPQTGAIQVLCLLSLVFGGLLWPLAWLWAYSKPVMYKLAYGTDQLEHGGGDQGGPGKHGELVDEDTKAGQEAESPAMMKARIVELEAQLARLGREAGRA